MRWRAWVRALVNLALAVGYIWLRGIPLASAGGWIAHRRELICCQACTTVYNHSYADKNAETPY
jgi:hypothetical protein